MIRILFPAKKRGAAPTAPLPAGNCGKGLGDKIERTVHGVAVALDWPCLDDNKVTLRPQSPCARARDLINKAELTVKEAMKQVGLSH